MNIIVSGWPASGGSTLAMVTSLMLDYKYLYAGGVLRFLADKMYGSGDGEAQMQFETHQGHDWDTLWEAYAEKKMQTGENILMEGKTAGFLIDGENIFKVMVTADLETRAERALGEEREDATEIIDRRDKEVRQRWIDRFGVDVYDLGLINRVYDVRIDTSGMSVHEEVEIMVDSLRRSMKFEGQDFAGLITKGSEFVKTFEEKGKLGLKQLLQDRNAVITPQQVLKDWNAILPEEVEAVDPALKEIILSYK